MHLSERHKELLTGLGLLLVFVIGFGGAELMLRIVQTRKYGGVDVVEKGDAFYREQGTGLRLPKPGVRLGAVRINSAGFRSPEIPHQASPGTLRLAFLGSSTTYDAGSPDEYTWPNLTAKMLQSHVPSGCTVDFLNAGLPGFGTSDMQAHFEAHVKQFRPDAVIILASDVTGDIQRVLLAQGVKSAEYLKPSWFAERSLLWGKIEKNVRIVRLQRAAYRTEGKMRFDHDDHAADFAVRLTMLTKTVRASGALPVLVTTSGQLRREQSRRAQLQAANTALFYNPFMSIPGLLDARDAYNSAIVRTGAATGAIVIEGENDIPGDREHFLDSAHFTPRGSGVMARRVVQGVVATGAVRSLQERIGGACAAH